MKCEEKGAIDAGCQNIDNDNDDEEEDVDDDGNINANETVTNNNCLQVGQTKRRTAPD